MMKQNSTLVLIGENDDGELVGGICISYWEKEEAKGSMFYFFKDGLKEEAV